MSKLVEEYIELAKKRSDDISDAEDDKIVNSMKELEKQFSGSDWDELIASVPVHIRPMIKKKKEEIMK